MFNKSGNKIAARAIAASLVVAGTLATECILGGAPAYSMEVNNPWESTDKQWQDCFTQWSDVGGKWTEQAKRQNATQWISTQEKHSIVLNKWLEIQDKRNSGKTPGMFDAPGMYDTPGMFAAPGMFHTPGMFDTPNSSPLYNPYAQVMAIINIFPINYPILLVNAEFHIHANPQMHQNLCQRDLVQNYQCQEIESNLLDLNIDKKYITSLNLTNNTKISGSDLSNYPNLTSLNLTNNTKISGTWLSNCPNLTSLNLTNNTTISGTWLSNCPNLTSLNLTNNTMISGTWLSSCPNLTSLNLTNNTTISGTWLSNCPNLTLLNLTNNTKITDSEVRSLRQKKPNLVIIGR